MLDKVIQHFCSFFSFKPYAYLGYTSALNLTRFDPGSGSNSIKFQKRNRTCTVLRRSTISEQLLNKRIILSQREINKFLAIIRNLFFFCSCITVLLIVLIKLSLFRTIQLKNEPVKGSNFLTLIELQKYFPKLEHLLFFGTFFVLWNIFCSISE